MNFAQELKKLNKEQRRAVEAIEGPVMVIAGPGTGKTQVLTLRIANILKKTDTPPESVLALTFTESAAASMRERLQEIMGPPASTRGVSSTRGGEAYRVSIKTIHGFCNEVIQNYPEEFEEFSGATNISEVEQLQLIRKLLDSPSTRSGQVGYRLFRSFGDPYRNAKEIIRAISRLKQEGKTPKDFEAIVKKERADSAVEQKRIARHRELTKLYAAYQHALRASHEYDYDDMIIEVAAALGKNKSLRFTLQEKYLYILVDEHQDTNQGQNKVIELLASYEQPNLFVVGDAKQAIFRFQGASVENFAYFKQKFKKAKVITLHENYRSHQTILDAALDIAKNPSTSSGQESRLKANVKHPKKKIKLAEFSSPDVEHYFVAADIKNLIEGGEDPAGSGVAPEQIAILYRDNRDAVPIARMLEKLGVPYTVRSDEDVLSDPDIKKLLLILAAVRDFGRDYALIPALYIDFLRIAPLDIALLLDAARQQRVSVFVLTRDKKALEKIIPDSAEKVFKLYQSLSVWKARSKNENPLAVFESVVCDSGFLAAVPRNSRGAEKLAKLHALFDELKNLLERKPGTMLDDFLDYLDIVRAHRVRIRSSRPFGRGSPPEGAAVVQLMTAHKAKGQEFEYVYVIGVTHGHWGSRRTRDLIKLPPAVYRHSDILKNVRMSAEDDIDERNVFYVALTRAKKDVTITYSQKNADGRDQLMSEFVSSIRPELIQKIETRKVEIEFNGNRTIEFRPSTGSGQVQFKEKKFLQQRFLEKGLSVSALNNYLECPLKFYYVNLIGIPQAQHQSAQIGEAAHGALRYAIYRLNDATVEPLTKRQFLDRFKYLLSKMPMRGVDYREGLKKGERALGAYWDFYSKGWPKNSKAEYSINDVKIGKIKIRGRIDRIDPVRSNGRQRPASNGAGFQVRVIDYKFKKPVSLSDDYRRQLTFYKLLLEKGTKWKMKNAAIDFLEPDSRTGRFRHHIFVPTDDDVKALEFEIKRVTSEILACDFFTKSCGDSNCKYCGLRAAMNK